MAEKMSEKGGERAGVERVLPHWAVIGRSVYLYLRASRPSTAQNTAHETGV